MKFLIIFIYLITTSYSYTVEKPNIDNLVINKNLKTYDEIVFKDKNQKNLIKLSAGKKRHVLIRDID